MSVRALGRNVNVDRLLFASGSIVFVALGLTPRQLASPLKTYDDEVILIGWTDQFYFEINAIRRMSETDDRQKARSACTIGTHPVIPAV